jgi:hypothetical protein
LILSPALLLVTPHPDYVPAIMNDQSMTLYFEFLWVFVSAIPFAETFCKNFPLVFVKFLM